MNKKPTVLTGLFVLLALALAACSGGATPTQGPAAAAGHIREDVPSVGADIAHIERRRTGDEIE